MKSPCTTPPSREFVRQSPRTTPLPAPARGLRSGATQRASAHCDLDSVLRSGRRFGPRSIRLRRTEPARGLGPFGSRSLAPGALRLPAPGALPARQDGYESAVARNHQTLTRRHGARPRYVRVLRTARHSGAARPPDVRAVSARTIPQALPNAADLPDNPSRYEARSTASGNVGPTGPSYSRGTAHGRLNRGTRTRLRRVKTRQVPCDTKRTGGRRRPPARPHPRKREPGRPYGSPIPQGQRSDPATVRQEATHASRGSRAREVEPGGPGNTPFGPQAHSDEAPRCDSSELPGVHAQP